MINRQVLILFFLVAIIILACSDSSNKYGYIDKTGKIVIEPQFDAAESFSDGLAAVKINNKWGYIDKNGKIIIKPQFDKVGPFIEDMAIISFNEKMGESYIDKSGKIINYTDKSGKIFSEYRFFRTSNFSEELAFVEESGLGKQGYIDKTGKMIISTSDYGLIPVSTKYSYGFAVFSFYSEVVFIDKSGMIKIAGSYELYGFSANSFSEGVAAVQKNRKLFFIDTMGKIVIEPFDTNASLSPWSTGFKEGLCLISSKESIPKYETDYLGIKRVSHYVGIEINYFIDKTGKIIIKPEIDNVKFEPKYRIQSDFHENYAIVEMQNREYGIIDKKGNIIMVPRCDKIEPFADGLARITVYDKNINNFLDSYFGYIDNTGKIIIEPIYSGAGDFSEGLAPVWKYTKKW